MFMALRVVLLLLSCASFACGLFGVEPKFDKVNGTVTLAGIISKALPFVKYKGAGGVFSLHRPIVRPTQYSSGHLKISNADDYIQVGWTVNPLLYGDTRTRLFTYFKAGDTHCFNLDCPGFKVTNPSIPLNYMFKGVSIFGGPIFVEDFFISQDKNGAWRLAIFQNKTEIGFWPKDIFSSPGLKDLATTVEWGGEVYSYRAEPGPQMGFGRSVEPRITDVVAFVSNISIVSENNVIGMPSVSSSYSGSSYYEAANMGDTHGAFGHLGFYGGPGAP